MMYVKNRPIKIFRIEETEDDRVIKHYLHPPMDSEGKEFFLHAYVRGLSDAEIQAAAAVNITQTMLFVINWRNGIYNNNKVYVEWKGQVYRANGYDPVEFNGRDLKFRATEEVLQIEFDEVCYDKQ